MWTDNAQVVGTARGGLEVSSVGTLHLLLDGIVKLLRVDRDLDWLHVSGHTADPQNECVDTLCRLASMGLLAFSGDGGCP